MGALKIPEEGWAQSLSSTVMRVEIKIPDGVVIRLCPALSSASMFQRFRAVVTRLAKARSGVTRQVVFCSLFKTSRKAVAIVAACSRALAVSQIVMLSKIIKRIAINQSLARMFRQGA